MLVWPKKHIIFSEEFARNTLLMTEIGIEDSWHLILFYSESFASYNLKNLISYL